MNELNVLATQPNMCVYKYCGVIKYRGWPYWRPHCTKILVALCIIRWRWAKVSLCPCKMRIWNVYVCMYWSRKIWKYPVLYTFDIHWINVLNVDDFDCVMLWDAISIHIHALNLLLYSYCGAYTIFCSALVCEIQFTSQSSWCQLWRTLILM